MLDKFNTVGIPVWIISLDLSNAFDRVPWPALSWGLVDEDVGWILQCINFGKCSEIVGHRVAGEPRAGEKPLQDSKIFRREIKQNHWKTIAARKGLPCFLFGETLRVKNMFTFKRVRVTLELGLGWLDPFNIIFHIFFHTFVFLSSFLLRLRELKGTNIVSEPKKVATPTNTHPHTKAN